MSRFAPRVFGERLQLDAGEETLDALKARSAEQRLEDARRLMERARQVIDRPREQGEITDAEFEDVDEC